VPTREGGPEALRATATPEAGSTRRGQGSAVSVRPIGVGLAWTREAPFVARGLLGAVSLGRPTGAHRVPIAVVLRGLAQQPACACPSHAIHGLTPVRTPGVACVGRARPRGIRRGDPNRCRSSRFRRPRVFRPRPSISLLTRVEMQPRLRARVRGTLHGRPSLAPLRRMRWLHGCRSWDPVWFCPPAGEVTAHRPRPRKRHHIARRRRTRSRPPCRPCADPRCAGIPPPRPGCRSTR